VLTHLHLRLAPTLAPKRFTVQAHLLLLQLALLLMPRLQAVCPQFGSLLMLLALSLAGSFSLTQFGWVPGSFWLGSPFCWTIGSQSYFAEVYR